MAAHEPETLAWITSFVAVADHGTFTAAAQALTRSQPRISAHIAALERQLGARLFDRNRRGADLTAAGDAFLPHAREVLRQLRAGTDAIASLADQLHGRIRIGSYPGAMAVIIAPLVHRYQVLYPGVTVILREDASPAALEEAVANNDLDLALRTADVPQRHHDVPSIALFDERIVVITRHDHPLAKMDHLDPSRLAEETVIVSGDPLVGWSDYRDRLDRIGVNPSRVITVVQPTTVVAMAREALGVGLLGALAAKVTAYSPEVATVTLPENDLWLREIRLYRHASAPTSPAALAFHELLIADGPYLTAGRANWQKACSSGTTSTGRSSSSTTIRCAR